MFCGGRKGGNRHNRHRAFDCGTKRLANLNLPAELERFVSNTLQYAEREKDVILGELAFPELDFKIEGKPVVVVVRGLGYKDDLRILSPFIQEANPVLIGVDGGADALLASGYRPPPYSG